MKAIISLCLGSPFIVGLSWFNDMQVEGGNIGGQGGPSWRSKSVSPDLSNGWVTLIGAKSSNNEAYDWKIY